VLVDCEHFFDGYKVNRDYALSFVRTAIDAGARWVVLCDTNGGTLPSEVSTIVAAVLKIAPGNKLVSTPMTTRGRQSPTRSPRSRRGPTDPGHAQRHR